VTVTCSCYFDLLSLSWWERHKAVVKSSQGADLSLIALCGKASALATPHSKTSSYLVAGLAAHTQSRA